MAKIKLSTLPLTLHPTHSRMLAKIKAHPLSVRRGPEFWYALLQNAEQVTQVDQLAKEYREHIRQCL